MAKRKDSEPEIEPLGKQRRAAAARRAEGLGRIERLGADHRTRSGARQRVGRTVRRPSRRSSIRAGVFLLTRRSPPRSFSRSRSAPSPARRRPRACCATRRRRPTCRRRRKPRPAGQRRAAHHRAFDAQDQHRQRAAQLQHAVRQTRRAARPHREGAGRAGRQARQDPGKHRPPRTASAARCGAAPAFCAGSHRLDRAEATPKEVPKPQVAEGWRLRDFYDGRAVVESRNGTQFRVGPGSNVPGLGRVETIKRENGKVVVVTASGIIAGVARAAAVQPITIAGNPALLTS